MGPSATLDATQLGFIASRNPHRLRRENPSKPLDIVVPIELFDMTKVAKYPYSHSCNKTAQGHNVMSTQNSPARSANGSFPCGVETCEIGGTDVARGLMVVVEHLWRLGCLMEMPLRAPAERLRQAIQHP